MRHDEGDRSILRRVPLRLAYRDNPRVVQPVQESRLVRRECVLEPMHVDGLLDELAVEDLVVCEKDVVTRAARELVEDAVGGAISAFAKQWGHDPASPASAARAAMLRPADQCLPTGLGIRCATWVASFPFEGSF